MTNKNIITATISVTIVHFILTSLIGNYIAVQIGTQMGKIVADRLIEASDKNPAKSEEEATRIYQNMKSKSDSINESWEIPSLLISFPAKPLITPLLKEMKRNLMNKYITKEITRDQYQTKGLMIDYTVNFLNSLSLGLLVFIVLRTLNQYKRKR